MKKHILLICSLLLYNCILAQPAPYKVVFDITSKDTMAHKTVVRWVKEILATHPEASIEVVFYGKSLDMITTGKSIVANDMIKLATNKNVEFRVCAMAMKRNGVDKSQLLQGVESVPDGIYEIISRQHEGWGYIKVSP